MWLTRIRSKWTECTGAWRTSSITLARSTTILTRQLRSLVHRPWSSIRTRTLEQSGLNRKTRSTNGTSKTTTCVLSHHRLSINNRSTTNPFQRSTLRELGMGRCGREVHNRACNQPCNQECKGLRKPTRGLPRLPFPNRSQGWKRISTYRRSPSI